MPALEEHDLTTLLNSLRTYSEPAMSAAIERARDPEVAQQLTLEMTPRLAALASNTPQDEDDCLVLALPVVLSEAKYPPAAEAMFTHLCRDDSREAIDDVVVYALRRMAEIAIRRALERLATAGTPWDIGTCYEVLSATADVAPAMHQQVIDAVWANIDRDTAKYAAPKEWDVAAAICSALLELKDSRVRPVIDRLLAKAPDKASRDE